MQYAILPVLSLLLVWFLAGAALPFTILAERRRAVTRRRAFYDKSADQIGALFWVTQLLPVLAVAADLLAGGLVARLAVGPWRLVWWTAVAAAFWRPCFPCWGGPCVGPGMRAERVSPPGCPGCAPWSPPFALPCLSGVFYAARDWMRTAELRPPLCRPLGPWSAPRRTPPILV